MYFTPSPDPGWFGQAEPNFKDFSWFFRKGASTFWSIFDIFSIPGQIHTDPTSSRGNSKPIHNPERIWILAKLLACVEFRIRIGLARRNLNFMHIPLFSRNGSGTFWILAKLLRIPGQTHTDQVSSFLCSPKIHNPEWNLNPGQTCNFWICLAKPMESWPNSWRSAT